MGVIQCLRTFQNPERGISEFNPQIQEDSDQRLKKPESDVLGFRNFVGFMVRNIVRKRIVHIFRSLRALDTGKVL